MEPYNFAIYLFSKKTLPETTQTQIEVEAIVI